MAAGVITQQTDQRTGVLDGFTYGFPAVVAMVRVQGEDRLTLTLKGFALTHGRKERAAQISNF